MYGGDPSILDNLGPEGTVLIIEVSSFQVLKMYDSSGMCPY